MLGGTDLVISLLVVFMGSLVYSTVSFGMGLVIVPFLLLFVLPIEAVIIVDVLIAIVAICVAFEARKEIVLNKTYVLIIGAAVAIPIGAYALDVTDPTVLKLVIGGAIIMLGIISLLGINVPLAKNRITGLAIGFKIMSMFFTPKASYIARYALYILCMAGLDCANCNSA